jgi:hypothetical protein
MGADIRAKSAREEARKSIRQLTSGTMSADYIASAQRFQKHCDLNPDGERRRAG